MLDIELKFFAQHQDEFAREHADEYVVIVGNSVIGFYPTEIDAYSSAVTKHALGTFLLRRCIPKGQQPVANFYTGRVTFA